MNNPTSPTASAVTVKVYKDSPWSSAPSLFAEKTTMHCQVLAKQEAFNLCLQQLPTHTVRNRDAIPIAHTTHPFIWNNLYFCTQDTDLWLMSSCYLCVPCPSSYHSSDVERGQKPKSQRGQKRWLPDWQPSREREKKGNNECQFHVLKSRLSADYLVKSSASEVTHQIIGTFSRYYFFRLLLSLPIYDENAREWA